MTDRATGSDLDAIHKSMNTLNYDSLKPLLTSDDSMALFAFAERMEAVRLLFQDPTIMRLFRRLSYCNPCENDKLRRQKYDPARDLGYGYILRIIDLAWEKINELEGKQLSRGRYIAPNCQAGHICDPDKVPLSPEIQYVNGIASIGIDWTLHNLSRLNLQHGCDRTRLAGRHSFSTYEVAVQRLEKPTSVRGRSTGWLFEPFDRLGSGKEDPKHVYETLMKGLRERCMLRQAKPGSFSQKAIDKANRECIELRGCVTYNVHQRPGYGPMHGYRSRDRFGIQRVHVTDNFSFEDFMYIRSQVIISAFYDQSFYSLDFARGTQSAIEEARKEGYDRGYSDGRYK